MAAMTQLSTEDFGILQVVSKRNLQVCKENIHNNNQIIELKTRNYELSSKLQKIEAEKATIQEKCISQERELQRFGKIVKFPGFQGIRNSKSQKDLADLMEENDRLTQQMQRHEDDFKLQSKTLLEEVSKLSDENSELQQQIALLKCNASSETNFCQYEAENADQKRTTEDSSVEPKTAHEQLELLQNQLILHKEASQKEIQQLREEVGEWSKKARRKQESFIKLQEEKEKMYEDNRTEKELLTKAKKLREEELHGEIQQLENKLLQMQDVSHIDELESMLEILRNENNAMQEEIISLKKKHQEYESEEIKDLKIQIITVNEEKQELQQKLEETISENQILELSLTELKTKIGKLAEELNQSEEVARKRKTILDQTSLERQQDMEKNRLKIGDLEQSYEKKMLEILNKNKMETEDLKSQIINHKKLKKENEDLQETIARITEDLNGFEQKSGWLERSLNESEELVKKVRRENENSVKEMKNKFDEEKSRLIATQEQHQKIMQEEIEKIGFDKDEQMMLVEKLKQAEFDRDVEFRIAMKKSDHLVKDLKRQCNTERKRADQLQSKLQDFIQEVKVKQTHDEIFNPESLQLKVAGAGHKRQDSGSQLSVVSSLSGTDTDDNARFNKMRKIMHLKKQDELQQSMKEEARIFRGQS